MSGSSARLVPWLVLGILVTACGRKPGPAADASQEAPAAPAAATAPAPASVAAVAVGAAKLPLEIRFEVLEAPRPGQPAGITLTLTASVPLQQVEIAARSAALQLDEVAKSQVLEGLEPGQPQQLELRFTPPSAGLADIELDVRAQGEGEPVQSRYAVPVLTVAESAGS